MMNQLEKALAEKYWNLPWMPARKMRNIIVHDYGGTDVEQVYSTIHNDLPFLKTNFSTIIKKEPIIISENGSSSPLILSEKLPNVKGVIKFSSTLKQMIMPEKRI